MPRKMDLDKYLVSLMEIHPNIYDKRDDCYKDQQKKQESWDAIAKTLSLDVETTKRRWENLRDRFVRIYREYTALGNSPLVRNKFKLFDHMLWLAPHIRKRRMTSAAYAVKKNGLTPKFNPGNDDSQSSETHESINLKSETQSVASDCSYTENYQEDDDLLPSAVDLLPSAADLLPSTAPRAIDIDTKNKSDHYFMMSVVQDCQAMPPRKKLKFKREVLELLEKYLYDVDQ